LSRRDPLARSKSCADVACSVNVSFLVDNAVKLTFRANSDQGAAFYLFRQRGFYHARFAISGIEFRFMETRLGIVNSFLVSLYGGNLLPARNHFGNHFANFIRDFEIGANSQGCHPLSVAPVHKSHSTRREFDQRHSATAFGEPDKIEH